MDALHAKLREVFGFSEFRAGQREVVERILSGRHTLAVRATDGEGEVQTADRAAPFPDGATGYHAIAIEVT